MMLTDWLQEFDLNLRERHLDGRDLPGNVFCHMTTADKNMGKRRKCNLPSREVSCAISESEGCANSM